MIDSPTPPPSSEPAPELGRTPETRPESETHTELEVPAGQETPAALETPSGREAPSKQETAAEPKKTGVLEMPGGPAPVTGSETATEIAEPTEPAMVAAAGASRRRLWGSGLVAALVLAVGVAAFVVVSRGDAPGDAVAAAGAGATVAGASAGVAGRSPAGVAPAGAGAVLARPAADAPGSEHAAWVAQEALATLTKETAGLLAGNYAMFAAGSAPSAAAALGRRFRSLRALKVTRFEQRIDGTPWPPATPGGEWRVSTVVDHCFVEVSCDQDLAFFDTLWRETPRGVRLTGFRAHDRKSPCYGCPLNTRVRARPWESTELAAMAGRRTLVAVPVAERGRLADLSRRAEAAAVIADRYTVGAGKVDRYRVFLADKASWKRWYDGYPGDWVAGRAVPTARSRVEVEVLAAQMTPDYADALLRHEMAHVSTLRNDSSYGNDDVWWLVEGMADYVKVQAGDRARDERQAVRSYLRTRKLGSVIVAPPGRDAGLVEAAGRYAVGYYALDHLIGRYGRPRALTFFEQAVQQGIGLDAASRAAFGKPWTAVDQECAAAVRGV
jgi:hypothetical protein